MKELKNKTIPELTKLISEKREVLRHFRFGSAGSKTKNVKAGHNVKKEIARIMTEISIRSRVEKKA
jgi:ribosomal protein L29